MTTYALLLSSSYEPLKVISARRAIQLILSGKAETIEASENSYRSASLTIEIPSVIRLRYSVKIPYKATVPLSRKAVIARDNATCQYCFKHGDTMDHVIPRSRGGLHKWENIVCACKKCNAKKANKTLKEVSWNLKTKPFAPRAWFYVVFQFQLDPAWKPYLPTL